jgi:hypothetical protein
MKKYFFVFILLAAIFIQKNLVAQASFLKGFVVLPENDTLFGEIKTNPKRPAENFKKAAYRKKEGNEIKSYNPTKLKMYLVGSSLFVSKILNNEVVFMHLISGGKLALYEFKEEVPVMNDVKIETDYYMQRGNGELVRIKPNKFKKQVAEMFTEKDEVVLTFPGDDLDMPKIMEWFKLFNGSLAE